MSFYVDGSFWLTIAFVFKNSLVRKPMHPKLHCWILQHVPVPQVIGCVLQQLNNQSLEAQQVCIATATDHLLQHPCNLPYARRLLTELVACLQQRHTDPTDRIADLLATTLLTALPDTGWRVKTLYYGPDSQHQDQAMVLHTAVGLLEGATGCHDWEAGFRLAEVVLSNPALVAGMHYQSPLKTSWKAHNRCAGNYLLLYREARHGAWVWLWHGWHRRI